MNRTETGKQEVFSVSELTGRIKRHLEMEFPDICIEGEVSNFSHYASGHMYFSLKDANAQIKCVMFSYANRRLNFRPENGSHIRAFGAISVYGPQGSYQLIVTDMTPAGLGELHIAFERLKAKLQSEGLFDQKWKKSIPDFPKRIGIVTSASGAAISDIVNVISRRYPLVDLVLCPTRVQGGMAASEIVRAIRTFCALAESDRPDVLIVGRGGGSIEDLWPFNEEVVARAVFDCDIPVISAVGHEVDFTICDFVADLRAPTPSAAAEHAVPDMQDIRRHLNVLRERLRRGMVSGMETRRMQLEQRRQHTLFRPQQLIRERQMTMDRVQDQLTAALKVNLFFASTRLARLRGLLMEFRPERKLFQLRMEIGSNQQRVISALREFIHTKKKNLSILEDRLSRHNLDSYRHNFDVIEARFRGYDPRGILEKGYAICALPDGTIVSSVVDAAVDGALDVEMKDGSLTCIVKQIRRGE